MPVSRYSVRLARRRDPTVSPTLEVLLLGRAGVDDDLARAVGPRAGLELERAEARRGRRRSSRRMLSLADGLPSRPMMSASWPPAARRRRRPPRPRAAPGPWRAAPRARAPLPLVEVSTISLPRDDGVGLRTTLAKRPSNDFCIVSVRMNVPLTIETPMTTANAVSSARILRPASPLSATAIIARSPARASRGSRARWTGRGRARCRRRRGTARGRRSPRRARRG